LPPPRSIPPPFQANYAFLLLAHALHPIE